MLNIFTSAQGSSPLRGGISLTSDVWFEELASKPSMPTNERYQIIEAKIGDISNASQDVDGVVDDSRTTTTTATLEVLPTDRIVSKDPEQWDRSPIVIEEFRLIFFSIPKVACTTWKQLFRRIMGAKDWQSHDGNKYLPHNPKFNNLKYLHHYHNLTQVRTMFLDPNWTKAIFVRDPKQRFLSAYLDKAVSNNGHFLRDKCCAQTPKDRHKCLSIPTCRTCLENGRSNLSSFLQLIHACRDDHWELQSARMDDKYWKYINFVGQMETLAEDGIRLMERIGAWERYGKDGWGPHGNMSMFVTSNQKQSHTTDAKSKMQSYYYAELEEQVEEFYSQDYENPLFDFVKTKVTS